MTMKPVQMSTVTNAEARPTVFEENRMSRIIRGCCKGSNWVTCSPDWEPTLCALLPRVTVRLPR
jgi:hypothetical protein